MSPDPREREKQEERRKSFRKMGLALTLPFTMLAGPIVGFGLGYLVDRRFDTSPAFLLIIGFAGVVGSFYRVFQTLKNME